MDKKLKNELKSIIKGHRPRPLMYVGWHNGRKCYIRKRDLTYWQLLEKYPKPFNLKKYIKPRHFRQKKHHFAIDPAFDYLYGCIIAGCFIAAGLFVTLFYLTLIIGALL